MKCTLLVNGQRIPLTLRVSSEQAEYNYGYDLKFNATNLAGGNLFYFPKSLDEFPTLELEYTGNQPVKIRKHIIKFKADKKTYKVQF